MYILADLPKPPERNHLWVIESQLYTNTYCIVATVGLFKVVTRSGMRARLQLSTHIQDNMVCIYNTQETLSGTHFVVLPSPLQRR